MSGPVNTSLLVAGWGSVAAALAHMACMPGGPDWFRFFGAGEAVARAVEKGRPWPFVVTTGIAMVLGIWAAYAFSAAGAIRRLPLLRLGLLAIIAVCFARAGAVFFPQIWLPEHTPAFRLVSSLIVGGLGAAFLLGLMRAWPNLPGRM